MSPDSPARAGVLRKIKGSGLKTRLLNPFDEYWDWRLGVSTFGYKPAVGAPDAPNLRMHYEPSPYRKLFRIFDRLELSGDDILVDFGSGLGRVPLAASFHGARKAIGVEIDMTLCDQARANRARSAVLAKKSVDILCMPAEEYKPVDVTQVYLFHPFGPQTMQMVVDNLAHDLQRSPRRVRVAYENPVHASVYDASPFFKRIDKWPADRALGSSYAVTFWEASA